MPFHRMDQARHPVYPGRDEIATRHDNGQEQNRT
jgi:hypothetical protein